MKRALTVAALILLTSCTTERVVYVEPTTTETARPSKSINVREKEYLRFVENTFGDIYGLTQDVLAAGWRICDRADEGWTVQDFIEDSMGIAETRETQELFAAVIAGALNYLCPENAYLLDVLDESV